MLKDIKSAYLIGIKGVGMTALAQILQSGGVDVSGSDTREKFFTDEVLGELKIPYKEGFSAKNVPKNTDLVIHSVAYTAQNNKEVTTAEKKGLNVLTYPEALANIFNDSVGIAVCGTHGKTTTSAMLGHVLEKAGFDPTAVVGGRVNQWGSNARVGLGKHFVIEADEYRDAFLEYKPKMIVLTNIDYDHPDYFKDKTAYRNTFKKFISKNKHSFLIDGRNLQQEDFNLKLPGKHNQSNANCAYAAAITLGVHPKTAREALEGFEGTVRRFEHKGVYKGAQLYDDYAHNPAKITALLDGAKELYPNKKVVFLFQPHTYSRTKSLFEDFVSSLSDADGVYILKTYASARERGEDTTGKNLAKKLNTKYFKDSKEATNHIKKVLNPSTVFVTVGAGDVHRVIEKLKV